EIDQAIKDSSIIIFAIPSAFLKETLEGYKLSLENKFIISAIKGIIPKVNLTIAEFFNQFYQVPFSEMGILTGPCHSEEIALERLSYLTIATKNPGHAQTIGKKLETRYLKTVLVDDIYGVEYASVLKNIFAIASGICHGLGYGDNFQSVLVANAFKEMQLFLEKTYPFDNRQVHSSAYLGDLLVTAYSNFSRNRTFGLMIGKGYSIKSAQLGMSMIAEGYFAVPCIKEINEKYKVNMPITNMVYKVLYQNSDPAREIKMLVENLV
ncbi:MAG: NAD(P)H-dependent glycerol-3-phosphate dehydrogenase, partial [bacterium]